MTTLEAIQWLIAGAKEPRNKNPWPMSSFDAEALELAEKFVKDMGGEIHTGKQITATEVSEAGGRPANRQARLDIEYVWGELKERADKCIDTKPWGALGAAGLAEVLNRALEALGGSPK